MRELYLNDFSKGGINKVKAFFEAKTRELLEDSPFEIDPNIQNYVSDINLIYNVDEKIDLEEKLKVERESDNPDLEKILNLKLELKFFASNFYKY